MVQFNISKLMSTSKSTVLKQEEEMKKIRTSISPLLMVNTPKENPLIMIRYAKE